MIFQYNTEAEYAGFGAPTRPPVYLKRPKTRPPKEEALTKMKTLMKSRDNADLLEHLTNDNFLSRFLYTRKMNAEASVHLLERYLQFRQIHPEIFVSLSVEDPFVQMCLRNRFPGVLPDRDRNGRCILFLSLRKWSRHLFSLEAMFKALLLLMDSLQNDTKVQYSGFVFLIDWNQSSIYVNPKQLKTLIEGLQDCYPARFKAIHFVNQPVQVDVLLTLVKPFLKEKTRDKIFVHGSNLSSLYEHIPQSILPDESFNGSVPVNTCIQDELIVPPGPVTRQKLRIV
uniref:Clavesin-1 n=1 Tax=Cacopsylla melanoneura TaxID=428564 RepID=A0A8D8S207_9HEMI